MLAAEQLPHLESSRRRRSHRRSKSSRLFRNLRRSWRSTRWRRAVISLVLTAAAVIGGYKVTMYVVNQEVNLGEFKQ